MRKIILVFIGIFFTFVSYADEVDSLIQVLNKTPEKDKAEILNLISDALLYSIPDSALYYAELAFENANINKNEYQSIQALKNTGRCFYMMQDFDNAILKFDEADSLVLQLIEKEDIDENKILRGNILDSKGRVLESVGDFVQALEIYQSSAGIFEELNNLEGMARVYNDMGYVHNALGNNTKALFYFKSVYEINKELSDLTGIATALNNIGIIYDSMGKRDSALYFYFESIKINEELGNVQVVAYLYHNIGIVYEFENQLNLALEYYQKSLDLTDEIGDIYGSVATLSRIAIVYREKGAYEKAVKMLNNSLKLADSIQSIDLKKDILLELSITYEKSGNADSALKYYKNFVELKDSLFGLNMMEQITEIETKYDSEKKEQQIKLLEKDNKIKKEEAKRRDTMLVAVFIILFLIIGLAVILFRAFRQKRKSNFLLQTQNAEILNQKEEIKAQAEELEKTNYELEKLSIVASETDNAVIIADKNGDIQWVNQAFVRIYGFTLEEFIAERSKNILEVSSEKEVKDKIDIVLNDKKSISYESSGLSKTGQVIYMQTTVTPLFDSEKNIKKLIIIDSDIRALKRAQQEIMQKSEEISAQNEEILAQNEEIEAKNVQITNQHQMIKGSIRYAQNIQSAILPPKELIDKHFDNFILYRPKDIVSGDFYWFSNPAVDVYFIAAIDCTGHGVPGAFMSMISTMLLNEIVNQNKVFSTKEILNKLKKSVESSLRQSETKNHDGLDIILSRISKKDKKITFSGAKLPMIIYRNSTKEIEKIKGDIAHIGGVYLAEEDFIYTEHEISYDNNDVMFLATDGYIDQNNEQRRRLGSVKFFSIIKENAQKSTQEQKIVFEKELANWQNNESQRDDITVIGVKF
ncbi:MAG: tetratricopeptide repeat protein [Bacteroidales bacterium]|nr:tetratricopeptide repeat protein [Bacteroidales bacterium]